MSWERALRVWRAAEAGGPLRDLIEWGKRIEVKGRELAARREEPIGGEDKGWLFDLHVWHQDCHSKTSVLEDMVFTRSEVSTIEDLRVEVGELYKYTLLVVGKGLGKPRKTPISQLVDGDTLVFLTHELREYNRLQMVLTGKSGIWLLNRVPQEEYSWSAFINDLDSCFHQFLNWLILRIGLLSEVAPRVYASSKSMPVAVESARLWSEATLRYNEWNLYYTGDYDALTALVAGNKAEIRVGSVAGHAAHVEFYPLYARVEYYDIDEVVHEVFMRLSERYGCTVVEHRREEATAVRIPRTSLVDFFQGVLPFATSMDVRLGRPCEYWCRSFREEYERLSERVKDPATLEYELCIKAYERLKKEMG